MKATYRVNPGLTVEVEGATQKEVFEQLARAAEVFGAHLWQECGRCKSPGHRPRPVVRTPQDFVYYELQCTNPECGARFSFGQNKDMKSLFPKPDPGWHVYTGPGHDEPPPPQPQARPAQQQGQPPARPGTQEQLAARLAKAIIEAKSPDALERAWEDARKYKASLTDQHVLDLKRAYGRARDAFDAAAERAAMQQEGQRR